MRSKVFRKQTFIALFALAPLFAQSPSTPGGPGASQNDTTSTSAAPVAATASPDYILGGGDQVQIDIPDLPDEFTSDKTFRIDGSGDLGLPLIGHFQAGGLAVKQLEELLRNKFKKILKNPDVTVMLTAFGSQPVSVLGAVGTPGMVQIAGHKNLFEVLSVAGGLADNAGYRVTITREIQWGPIPLPNAHMDASGQFSIASIKIKDLLDSSNRSVNIMILPNDKISVPPSELVYAVGNVNKPGGFPLEQHESLSALQVVSLAQGLTKTAAGDRARILRVVAGSPNRAELIVNLKDLESGKIPDFQLQPQDILFVPNSKAKSTGFRMLDALSAASGAAILTVSKF